MDSDFSSIRDLLFGAKIDPSSSGSNAIPLGARVRGGAVPSTSTSTSDAQDTSTAAPPAPIETAATSSKPSAVAEDDDEYDYDHIVHQLAFDKRAKPTDRTKTEEELALEEVERLQKQEKDRVRRMRGVPDDDEEEGEEGKRKSKKRRVADADDLEDDFDLDDDDEEEGVLGPGLEDGVDVDGSEDEEDEDESEDDHDDEASGEDGETVDDGSDTEGSNDDDGTSALIPSSRKTSKSEKSSTSKHKKGDELPFTFPCPATHEEFLDIIENIDESDVPTVISRIRTIYHPSLGVDNKIKLQVCVFHSVQNERGTHFSYFLLLCLDSLLRPHRPRPLPRLTSHILAHTLLNHNPPYLLAHQTIPDPLRAILRR